MLKMFYILIFLINISLSLNSNSNCYLKVIYSNGSQYLCLDEECSINHIDIISFEILNQCQTNYLSLKYSSYSKYFPVLFLNSFSSFFSFGRPNIERLLQIEFLSPLENNFPFELDHLRLLTNSSLSNIDTYELIFNGNISKNNSTLFIDENIFMSNEQQFIDTLRLIFNCTNSQRVEWELIKSISSLPPSPCPKQINFLNKNKNKNYFYLNILISLIALISILILIIICLFLWNYRLKQKQLISNSQKNLIEFIEKF